LTDLMAQLIFNSTGYLQNGQRVGVIMRREEKMKIFAGSSSKKFASAICTILGTELGQSETIVFTEGNIFVRVLETVRDKDIYLVQSVALQPNDEFMEILFWIDAFKRANANSVTLVMPYFGYAKGDKKDEPRVSIRARVCADAIEAAGADRVVTMDLHSPQIQGFFKKSVDHLYAIPVLCEALDELKLKDVVAVAPDAGFAKQVRKYAGRLKASVAIGDKIRCGHDEKAEIITIIGDVKGRDAVITDDFTITCNTLADIARVLKDKGANRIVTCVSHLLLDSRGIEVLEKSAIELLLSTDTVPNLEAHKSKRIRIVSAAGLFADTVKRIHHRESVSVLFEDLYN
jgi:ribose-phosphate pyrophosphokinase